MSKIDHFGIEKKLIKKKTYSIGIFDSRKKEYGGYNHFIAGKIFRWRLCYLSVYLKKKFKFEIIHNNDEHYYDGYHNHIWIGWILISYGT